MVVAENIIDLIGETPVVSLKRMFPGNKSVWMKLEKSNPGGSIKDRLALALVEDAEAKGVLRPGGLIVEASSGNTGIGLALVAAVKGYECILTMPESMSIERRKVMAAYGATVVLTPRELGMKGAVQKAEEIARERGNAWIPMQFANPANVAIHHDVTAAEVIRDFPEGLDYLITGVGTGGHFTGMTRKLKTQWPQLKAIAVEPAASHVITGGRPGPHRIQGIGAGFIPDNFDLSVADDVVRVHEEDAFRMAQRCVVEEGLFVGISTGASLAAVAALLPSLPDGACILTMNYDGGDRYNTVPGFLRCDPTATFRSTLLEAIERTAFACSHKIYACQNQGIPVDPGFGAAVLRRQKSGQKNAFGQAVQVVQARATDIPRLTDGIHDGESEKKTGATFFAFSHNLLDLLPTITASNTARFAPKEFSGVVVHVAALVPANSTEGGVVLELRPDHADTMAVSDSNTVVMASRSLQEASDLTLAAHLASAKLRRSVVHFFDDPAIADPHGFFADVQVCTDVTIAESLTAMSVDEIEEAMDERETQQSQSDPVDDAAASIAAAVKEIGRKISPEEEEIRFFCDIFERRAEELFGGRQYGPCDVVRSPLKNAPSPSTVIIVANTHSSSGLISAVAESSSPLPVNIIAVRVLSPFPSAVVQQLMPTSATKVIVVDFTSQSWSPLFLRAAEALAGPSSSHLEIISCLVRPSFAPIEGELATSLLEAFTTLETDLALGPDVPDWLMLSGEATSLVERGQAITVFSRDSQEGALGGDVRRESFPVYEQMLRQTFGTRLRSPSVISHVGTESSDLIEVDFGRFLSVLHQRQRLVEDVGKLLARSVSSSATAASSTPAALAQFRNLSSALMGWIETQFDASRNASHVERVVASLAALSDAGSQSATPTGHNSDAALIQAVRAQTSLLTKPSLWLVGGEELQYSAGLAAIHHIIASGEDVNILIVETAPVAALRGDVVHSGRGKKDIGLYAMEFGNSYVASVAKYASYTHVLQALKEADSFRGPSIVLAYAPTTPSTAAARKASSSSSGAAAESLEMMRATKEAIEEGLWPLYRFDPRRESTGEEPFQLDSEKLQADLSAFLDKRNQLTLLAKQEATLPSGLGAGPLEISHRQILSSFAKLSGQLGGPPLLVLYASDTGNGAGCARELASAASRAGFNGRHLAMDDMELADLAAESRVVFCVSTAGQGEIPSNGQNLWKAIRAQETPDLFGTLEYAVFGLGDSHYWPNPGDEKYFCKPAVDLDRKLEALGGRRLIPLVKGDDQATDGYKGGFREFQAALWPALGADAAAATAGGAGGADPNALPPDDVIKAESNYLRGTIAEGLLDTSTGALSERDCKLTKFHGIYQQDDRDLREQRRQQHLEPAFSFMIRVGIPGGVCTPEQWLVIDELCDEYGNGGFKLTTRQAFQFHGILKGNLKPTIQKFTRALMTSLAACGDVCRNIIANPMPHQSPVHAEVWEFCKELQEAMRPLTPAYHEIWLDKKLVGGGEMREVEPLYGKTYLPRKFKVAIAVPPMNDVDVQAHCLGYIAILEAAGTLAGYTVTVGGGMGMTHNNAKTYPRLADPLCFVRTRAEAIAVGLAVLRVQRDHGERLNRKHARLKYTVEDMGLEQFRAAVQEQVDFALEDPRPFIFSDNRDRFGWFQDDLGSWNYGCFVEHGRVIDRSASETGNGAPLNIRSALQEIARIHKGDFRLTANQGVYIARVRPEDRAAIDAILSKYKINTSQSALRQGSMACVALPTCALAMAESERYLPHLVTKLEGVIDECGLRNDSITIRMTGCPNGCARPYLGEIGFVGRAPGYYNLYLGAAHDGTRLNKLYKSSINEEQILAELQPIIRRYAKERLSPDERFGDFVIRAGIIKASGNGKLFHEFTEVGAKE